MTLRGARPRTDVGWFLAAGVVAALLNAVFQRVSARRIPVDDLGAFNALVWVIGGVALLGLGLQVVIGRLRPRSDAMPSLGHLALLGGLALGGLVAAGVPGPAWYRAGVGGLMALTAAALFCGVAPRARLLRESRWAHLGITYVVGAAIRVAALVPLSAVFDTQLLATLAATALSEIGMSVIAWRLAPRRGSAVTRITRAEARRLLLGFTALAGLWTLTVADTLLARTRLTDADADSYAFASTVARASFFAAQLLVHLALPTFMREEGRNERLRRIFSVTALTVLAIAAVAALVLVALPRPFARLFLGSNADLVDISTLRTLAVAWAAMSLLPLLTYFHTARHPRLAFVPAVASVAVLAAGALIDEPGLLASATCAAVVVALLVMGVPAAQRLRPVTRSVEFRTAQPAHAATSDVAFVVPFFNPGPDVVVATVRRLVGALESNGAAYRVIAVSDGSDDGSAEALRDARLPNVSVVELPHNRGKGAALRAGLERASAPLIGYIDADGDLPPEQIGRFLDIATSTGADAVIGSKIHPDSELPRERVRRALSALFRVAVRVLFRLDVRDTQTGLKVYRGEVVAPLVPLLREDGFAIDVEILVAATRAAAPAGSLTILEAPVTIVDRAGSTVSSRRAAATVAGLLRIFWRDHVALLYTATSRPPSPVTATR